MKVGVSSHYSVELWLMSVFFRISNVCICILGGSYWRHERTKRVNWPFSKKHYWRPIGVYEYCKISMKDKKGHVQTFLFNSGVGIELLEGFERLVLLKLFRCLLSRELYSLLCSFLRRALTYHFTDFARIREQKSAVWFTKWSAISIFSVKPQIMCAIS